MQLHLEAVPSSLQTCAGTDYAQIGLQSDTTFEAAEGLGYFTVMERSALPVLI